MRVDGPRALEIMVGTYNVRVDDFGSAGNKENPRSTRFLRHVKV